MGESIYVCVSVGEVKSMHDCLHVSTHVYVIRRLTERYVWDRKKYTSIGHRQH